MSSDPTQSPDEAVPEGTDTPQGMRPADEMLIQLGLITAPDGFADASQREAAPSALAELVDEPSPDPLIQYYVVDQSLGMSAGKLGAQTAHAATLSVSDLERKRVVRSDSAEIIDYETWLNSDMRKIVLRGSNKDLLRLEAAGGYAVRDNGHTEVPAGSLTVVALRPMRKSQAAALVKRLQVYKS